MWDLNTIVKMSKLSKIENKLTEIYHGWVSYVIKDPIIEEKAMHRAEICSRCEHADGTGKSCYGLGIWKPCCDLCGCPLATKTRSKTAKCPEGKW